jgi:hypothetical protein
MPTEMTRIKRMSDAERALINILTPAERLDALRAAAQSKQRRVNRQLMREHLDRIRSGELAPLTADPITGERYSFVGRTVYYRDQNEPMIDLGWVPGHEGMHVLKKPDGTLFFTGGFHLRDEGEPWEDVLDGLTR